MRERSSISGMAATSVVGDGYSDDGEAIVRERLSGLGYIG